MKLIVGCQSANAQAFGSLPRIAFFLYGIASAIPRLAAGARNAITPGVHGQSRPKVDNSFGGRAAFLELAPFYHRQWSSILWGHIWGRWHEKTQMMRNSTIHDSNASLYRHSIHAPVVVALVLCVLCPAGILGQPHFTINEFPPEFPIDSTGASSVSDFGDVGGVLSPYLGDLQPSVWVAEKMILLELPRGLLDGSVASLNSQLQIVGQSNYSVSGLIWENMSATEIGVLPGATNSYVGDINELGHVTGYSGDTIDGEPPDHAFIWDDGTFTDLGLPDGFRSVRGYGINNLGEVVGYGTFLDSVFFHATIYSAAKWTDLGTLPQSLASSAFEVNDYGEVVGYASGNSITLPVRWQNEKIAELPRIEGYEEGIAFAISNSGQIVGENHTFDGLNYVGVLWEDGQVYNLVDLIPFNPGWTSLTPYDISDAGHIAGTGSMGFSPGRAFLMTPIPEPCTADANGDKLVDPLDAGYVLARFSCPVGAGDPACDAADVNADGLVDPLDVGYVLSRFGECR